MRENDFLTRYYQRENAQKLAYDLGFRLENKDLVVDKEEKVKCNEVDGIVDELTPCLVRNEDGAIVNTTMVKASKSDIDQVMNWKNRKKDSTGKTFDWTKQQRISNSIRLLKLEGESEVQGIIGFTPNQSYNAIIVELVENNPANSSNGKYLGVLGHLMAFACKEALEQGFDSVYFESKTKLIEHYKKIRSPSVIF